MELNDLAPELQEKAKACETAEELLALAKEEGVELTDADLDAVSGGSWGGCGDDACTTHRFCRSFR